MLFLNSIIGWRVGFSRSVGSRKSSFSYEEAHLLVRKECGAYLDGTNKNIFTVGISIQRGNMPNLA